MSIRYDLLFGGFVTLFHCSIPASMGKTHDIKGKLRTVGVLLLPFQVFTSHYCCALSLVSLSLELSFLL